MNVYDFDKTIYPKDSSIQFYVYSLRRKPSLFRYWPRQIVAFTAHYIFRTISKTQMKERFYCYFQAIPNIEQNVNAFWQHYKKDIQPWYLQQKQPDDLIISASPEFLLQPICQDLGIRLIASKVDPKTGLYHGENCYGQEKVVRLMAFDPDAEIDEFYSDSYSDTPLADLAKTSYIVNNSQLTPWVKA